MADGLSAQKQHRCSTGEMQVKHSQQKVDPLF
jgi:hypothetical protein